MFFFLKKGRLVKFHDSFSELIAVVVNSTKLKHWRIRQSNYVRTAS